MRFGAIVLLPAFLLVSACAGGPEEEIYPDVTARPERPAADLTPEQREAYIEELRAAREEAIRHATEGRPPREGETEVPVVGDEDGNEEAEESEEDNLSE